MTSSLAKLDRNFEIPNVTAPMNWYDLASLPTEGQGWPGQTPGRYGRLPAKAQGVVRDPVWNLGERSAGLAVRFVTDSPKIAASWDIDNPGPLAMGHMPATGMSGLDLYVRSGSRWRWAGNTRPDGAERTFTQMMLGDICEPAGQADKSREYLLYLPLYNIASGVRIGVTPGSRFEAAPARSLGHDRPICFYGTSILQGGCASRPGMAYPSIIGRMMNRAIINLGFSGNAKSEPEVVDLLAELDPVAFVLDPLPNMVSDEVLQRTIPMVTTIRNARLSTPIFMVENITYQQGHINKTRYARYTGSNRSWRAMYEKLLEQGVTGLHYIPGENLLGDDDEGTVDGTHATDLGFMRMAQAITPHLQRVLPD